MPKSSTIVFDREFYWASIEKNCVAHVARAARPLGLAKSSPLTFLGDLVAQSILRVAQTVGRMLPVPIFGGLQHQYIPV